MSFRPILLAALAAFAWSEEPKTIVHSSKYPVSSEDWLMEFDGKFSINPGEDSQKVHQYKSGNSWLMIFENSDSVIKIVLFDRGVVSYINPAIVSFSSNRKFITTSGRRYQFHSKYVFGPTIGHPDPISLPPIPQK